MRFNGCLAFVSLNDMIIVIFLTFYADYRNGEVGWWVLHIMEECGLTEFFYKSYVNWLMGGVRTPRSQLHLKPVMGPWSVNASLWHH